MNRCESFDRFQLNDNFILYEQVNSIADLKFDTVIDYGHPYFG